MLHINNLKKERSLRRGPGHRQNNQAGGCRKGPEATASFPYHNVVRFDISMKDITGFHFLQAIQ